MYCIYLPAEDIQLVEKPKKDGFFNLKLKGNYNISDCNYLFNLFLVYQMNFLRRSPTCVNFHLQLS